MSFTDSKEVFRKYFPQETSEQELLIRKHVSRYAAEHPDDEHGQILYDWLSDGGFCSAECSWLQAEQFMLLMQYSKVPFITFEEDRLLCIVRDCDRAVFNEICRETKHRHSCRDSQPSEFFQMYQEKTVLAVPGLPCGQLHILLRLCRETLSGEAVAWRYRQGAYDVFFPQEVFPYAGRLLLHMCLEAYGPCGRRNMARQISTDIAKSFLKQVLKNECEGPDKPFYVFTGDRCLVLDKYGYLLYQETENGLKPTKKKNALMRTISKACKTVPGGYYFRSLAQKRTTRKGG